MSIFSSISNAAHTFAAWFEKTMTRLESSAPAIEKTASASITYAVTALKIVAAQFTPGSGEATTISAIITKLVTLSSVVYDMGAHPSLAGEFQVVVDDLNQFLSLGSIKNANLVSGITKVVSTIAALVSAFATVAPAV